MKQLNAKEKAWQLYNKFYPISFKHPKQCALIACDEIIEVLKGDDAYNQYIIEYWQEVRNQINIL